MNHTVLTVVIANRQKGLKIPNAAQQKRLIESCGGLVFTDRSHVPTACRLSVFPWVDRVVATHVQETNIGTWRGGTRS